MNTCLPLNTYFDVFYPAFKARISVLSARFLFFDKERNMEMELTIRKLTVDDAEDIYNMLQEIPAE